MSKLHEFNAIVTWKGETINYSSYSRNHNIGSGNKPLISGSSDPVFRGDGSRYNPEELLIASASACHMLWYLHLCADAGIVVLDYTDNSSGTMQEEANGGGRFKEILLNPLVTVKEKSMVEKATKLHDKAGQMCFIANSCNFPIKYNPIIKVL